MKEVRALSNLLQLLRKGEITASTTTSFTYRPKTTAPNSRSNFENHVVNFLVCHPCIFTCLFHHIKSNPGKLKVFNFIINHWRNVSWEQQDVQHKNTSSIQLIFLLMSPVHLWSHGDPALDSVDVFAQHGWNTGKKISKTYSSTFIIPTKWCAKQ